MGAYDVAVIGGGPSGLHAASLLAEKGLKVIVAEKKDEIGSNVICTGIVGKEIFEEFSIPPDSVIRDIQAVKLVSSSGNSICYRHPSTFACIVDRKAFDQSLADKARAAGAEIALGTCVRDAKLGRDGVEIETEGANAPARTIEARMAVLATGIDHRLNKKLGLGVPEDHLLGAQAELEVSNGAAVTVFVGKHVAPGAFAWAVPTEEGRLRLGLLTAREPRTWFLRLLEKFYPEKMAEVDPDSIQIKAIAQGVVSRTYGERAVSLGEAAGQIKTTTGGGIYFGLVCSRIAAETIHDCFKQGSYSAERLSAYDKTWRAAIQREIVIGHYARRVFSLFTDSQIERLFELAKSDGIIPLIQTKGRFDWQSGLLIELAKKVPPLSYFSDIRKKLDLFDRFLS